MYTQDDSNRIGQTLIVGSAQIQREGVFVWKQDNPFIFHPIRKDVSLKSESFNPLAKKDN